MGSGKRVGEVAVIFTSRRTEADAAGYDAAVAEMDARAATMPGYRGRAADSCWKISARGPDGLGITISYWADEAAAIAWRDEPRHAATREAGRQRWYSEYEVVVATVTRDYAWRK